MMAPRDMSLVDELRAQIAVLEAEVVRLEERLQLHHQDMRLAADLLAEAAEIGRAADRTCAACHTVAAKRLVLCAGCGKPHCLKCLRGLAGIFMCAACQWVAPVDD